MKNKIKYCLFTFLGEHFVYVSQAFKTNSIFRNVNVKVKKFVQ